MELGALERDAGTLVVVGAQGAEVFGRTRHNIRIQAHDKPVPGHIVPVPEREVHENLNIRLGSHCSRLPTPGVDALHGSSDTVRFCASRNHFHEISGDTAKPSGFARLVQVARTFALCMPAWLQATSRASRVRSSAISVHEVILHAGSRDHGC